jgi:sulfur transfer protein SufE
MRIALLMLLFLTTASPVLAGPHRASRSQPSTITCETVRAYVSRLGFAQAKAMARANGMTDVQERRARQCLARGD